jgi:hypothetical protein
MSLRASGLVLSMARPAQLFGPTSIFREPAASLTVNSSQELKEKLANQLYYGNKKQGEENKFFGYSGMGYNGSPEGFYTAITFKEYSNPLYVVAPTTPRVKVWLVKGEAGPEEELQEEGFATNLQGAFAAVPMPNPALTLKGSLEPAGTDRAIVVWCPGTDEMWEMERLGKFAEGPHAGAWKFNFGGYISRVSQSNGIPPHGWGASASGLGIVGGNISVSDMVSVLRGKPIGHAIGIAVGVTLSPTFVAPATRADTKGKSNTYEFLEDGVTKNPAFGLVDAVPEGLWCRFPPASRASEYGISTSLAKAMYEAIREYGLFVRDGSGNSQFFINDPRSLGSIYSDTLIDPFAETTNEGVYKYIEELMPTGWRDPTLEVFTEQFAGNKNLLNQFPWRTLEQLEPRSS